MAKVADARNWITWFKGRHPVGNYENILHALYRSIAQGEFTLHDLDIDEGELTCLILDSCTALAREQVTILRQGTSNYEAELQKLHKHLFFADSLAEDGFSLADLGIDEEELACFRFAGSRRAALQLIGALGTMTDMKLFFEEQLHEEMAKGGWRLEDLGVDEPHLRELCRKWNFQWN